MARLRLLTIASGADPAPVMLDDQTLADRIAAGISSGALRVCGAATVIKLYGLVAAKAPAAAPAAPVPAPAAPRAPHCLRTGAGAGAHAMGLARVARQVPAQRPGCRRAH